MKWKHGICLLKIELLDTHVYDRTNIYFLTFLRGNIRAHMFVAIELIFKFDCVNNEYQF